MRISDSDLKKLLLASQKVTLQDLDDAARSATQSEQSLLSVVLKRNLIDEKDLLKIYGKSINVPFIELKGIRMPKEVLTKIPERTARKYDAVLFGKLGNSYQLAMSDPEDLAALDFVRKSVGGDVKTYVASSADILAALDQYRTSMEGEITKAIKSSEEEESKDARQPEVSAKDLAEDAPIAKTVNIILEYGLRFGASDIHIEPRENIIQVRYRVDGILQESMTLPRTLLAPVVSRVKILANLKIDEHRLPQDGRFKFQLGSKMAALRVSTLPVMDGEKVVIRILDESAKPMTLEQLGLEGRSLQVIDKGLDRPFGMTLVTGPTGAGKSTTLYSILSIINRVGVNISTVEDPVEYKIAGVNQTQVNPQIGLTFANGLRALVRQDPNIIMVGEIRDRETAELAVQASLTGHLMLSTLHTNNAATSLPRLLEMGIEPFLIASTINTVIGQRLVRRVCNVCRIPHVPEGMELQDLAKEFNVEAAVKYYESTKVTASQVKPATSSATLSAEPSGKVISPLHNINTESIITKIKADPAIIDRSANQAKMTAVASAVAVPAVQIDPSKLKPGQFILYKAGKGCSNCHSGYLGRIGIYEVLEVSDTVQKLIVSHGTSDDIQNQAIKEGMLTMQQDGFVKALRGMTTVEEVMRVTKE